MIKKGMLLISLIAGLCFLTTPAKATSLTYELLPFTGDPVRVLLTVDDETTPNEITFDLQIEPNLTYPNTGDLRGLFFNIDVDSFPSLLNIGSFTNIFGGPVTTVVISNDNVTYVGGSNNNINPAGPFDVGIEIGEEGLGGGDDFQSSIFSIDSQGEFDIFDLLGEMDPNGYLFAARVMSVGLPSNDRGGSSKVATPPIPEPATMLLLGSGLVGLVGLGRKKFFKKS